MIHKLKIEPPYFQAVVDGQKTFEIRFNDRGYQAGDEVILREYDPTGVIESHKFTGREEKYKIGYVTAYAQKDNWVVFSLIGPLT